MAQGASPRQNQIKKTRPPYLGIDLLKVQIYIYRRAKTRSIRRYQPIAVLRIVI